MADLVDRLVKIKFGTIFNRVTGAAYLFDNAAWTFTPQSDDIAVPLGLRLLHMTFSRTMTGFTLHAVSARFRVASVCTQPGNSAVELIGARSIICVHGGMCG